MRVFITGATGFIGSAIVREMLDAGHDVVGLARSDATAHTLVAQGAQVHRGALDDPESLRRGADESDGVIHTAFVHDFTRYKANCETDRHAIEALGSALAGTRRPLVVTSGTAVVGPGHVAKESDPVAAGSDVIPRVATEEAAAAVASRGVRVSVVRLPPSVHGEGDHGFVPLLIGLARERHASAYVGAGQNRWPAVHRLDAAQLFRLAFEQDADGTCYHGVAEEGVAFADMAEVIGRRLGAPMRSIAPEHAAEHFGWFAPFAMLDNPTSSERTRTMLSWTPTRPGLLEDMDRAGYFDA